MTTPPTTPAASEGPYSKRDTGRKTHGINWFDLVGPGITPGEHEGDSLTLNERVKYANLGHSSALASREVRDLVWAAEWLLRDVLDYDAWNRPCAATEALRTALAPFAKVKT